MYFAFEQNQLAYRQPTRPQLMWGQPPSAVQRSRRRAPRFPLSTRPQLV